MLRCADTDIPVWKLNTVCHRGPLLFLLYIIDLPLNIHGANPVMFAGDINILIPDSDVCAFQRRIDSVIIELEI